MSAIREVHDFCSWYLGVNFLIYRTLGFLFLLHRQQLYQGFDSHALWKIGEEERACFYHCSLQSLVSSVGYHSNLGESNWSSKWDWCSKWVPWKPHFYHFMNISSSFSKNDIAMFVTIITIKMNKEKNCYIGPSCMFKSQEMTRIICVLVVNISAKINRNKIF